MPTTTPTETVTVSGNDPLVPAGSTVTATALSDDVTSSFDLGSAKTQADGSYTISATVPVADLSFATFIEVDDSKENIVVGFGGSVNVNGFSATETTTTTPPPSGGLKADLQTLIHDFFAHADTTQLKADLTAVVTDIKDHNFGTADSKTATMAATDFIDHLPKAIIGHS